MADNDWDLLQAMLEAWMEPNLRYLGYARLQALIPLRDFIFDRTTEGRKYR